MNVLYDSRVGQKVRHLLPGEFGASGEDWIYSTVLGSCVAVTLYDSVSRIGGMNHFMLPGTLEDRRFYLTDSGRYGMYAMELLLNAVAKAGGERSRLVAKVIGGGSVLRGSGLVSRVPRDNINFAFDYLGAEGIPVISSHVGGDFGRKIYFYLATGKVLLRRIGHDRLTPVEQEERRYFEQTQKDAGQAGGRLTLF